MSYLKSLQQLESLQLYDRQQRPLFNFDVVGSSTLADVLGSLPQFRALNIDAHNNLGDQFILDLGRACRGLLSLSLTGTYTLEHLSFETNCLFPVLEILDLGRVTPRDPNWRDDPAFSQQEWADRVAGDLFRHSPKLRHIKFCLDGMDELARMAANSWWFLKDKRDFRIFLERDGTEDDETIDLWVSELTPTHL